MKTNTPPHRTLGPVPDLERHLPADWWRTLFNAVYLRTDGDVVENDAATHGEVDRLLKVAGLEPNDRILDVCCGQGRHSLELARRGFRHVTGVDRSRYLIRLARRRARDAHLEVRFREGDARRLSVGESAFDAVIVMGNSFGYFDQEAEDLAVLSAIKRALRSRGKLVLDLTDGAWMRDHFERRSWEWIDQDHFVCRERSLSRDRDRLISREVVVHAEKGVLADQFYAERLYDRGRIQQLLEAAGFGEIRVHDTLMGESTRGEDLGMMARRLFLTARAPAKSAAAARKTRTVTVLMGDPRLPDDVKRGGKFNPEDLETISKLKEALAELGNLRFEFVDNHEALLETLKMDRPELVLNFCDEGFNNDATMELHVAAYLEMLGIPYSGAGPAALGLCYDKALVRAIAADCDVPVPLETRFDVDDQAATLPSVFPALIKPALGDSSIGITKNAVVETPSQMVAYLSEVRQILPGRPILVQEYLSGAEYSVGLVGNPGHDLTALPILEVDYGRLDPSLPRILGYESKWEPDSPYWKDIAYREAVLEEELRRFLIDASATLFQRLGCRDYARFDFRADSSGRIKLLEVNPNPGWCWDGKLNLMAGFAGHRYAELLEMILDAFLKRVGAEMASPAGAQARVSLH
jgi:D-alanine-D-alanine ligase